MSTNEYGFDHHYMEKRLKRMLQSIDRYIPDEAFNEISNMAMVAANQADLKVTMKVKHQKDNQ